MAGQTSSAPQRVHSQADLSRNSKSNSGAFRSWCGVFGVVFRCKFFCNHGELRVGLPPTSPASTCAHALPCHTQDRVAEQRAKRKRLLHAVQSARIRKGMIRYLVLVRRASHCQKCGNGVSLLAVGVAGLESYSPTACRAMTAADT